MDMNWYVIYTKPGSEKKVSEILTRRKIENYSPVNNLSRNWSDNKKTKDTPLFKGYVFVKSSIEQHDKLKKINSIINFVYWMGKPVSIQNQEIKAIKLFLNEYKNVTIEKTKISLNSVAKTDNHKLEQEVPLITIKNKKAYVSLPSLGYSLIGEVETPNVRIISTANKFSNENIKQNKLFNRVTEINNSLKSYWVKAFILSICIFLSVR